jgi:hypothetical protein
MSPVQEPRILGCPKIVENLWAPTRVPDVHRSWSLVTFQKKQIVRLGIATGAVLNLCYFY